MASSPGVLRRKTSSVGLIVAAAGVLSVAFWFRIAVTADDDIWIPNLHRTCLRCLCEAATGCNGSFGCPLGYCGPFKVAKVFWIDAGRIVLPNDNTERAGAYEDCASLYNCAARMVTSYMSKLGKDCNGDGLVNCDDYALIHFNGGFSCEKSLDISEAGRLYNKRYHQCKPPDKDDDPLGRSVAGL